MFCILVWSDKDTVMPYGGAGGGGAEASGIPSPLKTDVPPVKQSINHPFLFKFRMILAVKSCYFFKQR
jgi:hypothetical protein